MKRCSNPRCKRRNRLLPYTEFHKNQNMCKKCKRIRNAQYKKTDKRTKNNAKAETISWICKCPGCGMMHKKRLFWTGRSNNPPIMCNSCKRFGEVFDDEEYKLTYGG